MGQGISSIEYNFEISEAKELVLSDAIEKKFKINSENWEHNHVSLILFRKIKIQGGEVYVHRPYIRITTPSSQPSLHASRVMFIEQLLSKEGVVYIKQPFKPEIKYKFHWL